MGGERLKAGGRVGASDGRRAMGDERSKVSAMACERLGE